MEHVLEKLIFPQLVKQFSPFDVTRVFITTLTRISQLYLCLLPLSQQSPNYTYVYYHSHKNLLIIPILSQINPVETLQNYLF